MASAKIKKLDTLKKITASLKKSGKRIVFTNGCFDLIHYGHVKYLQDAKKLGNYLIVGLNSDSSVRKIKGDKRPIIAQQDRANILAALEMVDFVVIFNELNPLKLIKALAPNILVKGADWHKDNIIGADYVLSYNGKVKTIPFVKNRSSSSLINSILHKYAKKF